MQVVQASAGSIDWADVLRFGTCVAYHFGASNEDADDAVQTVLLRMLRLQQRQPDTMWGRQYIYVAVSNELRNIHRSAKRFPAKDLEECHGLAAQDLSLEEQVALRQRLAAIGPTLTPEQQVLLVRRLFEPNGEYSNANKQMMYRIRRRLAKRGLC